MIREEEVFRIGRLGKTHGVRGEISFLFDDDVFDRADADYLVLEVDGILVPFFIEEYRFKSESNAIMKLEGVDSQGRARELTGCDVYFPRDLAESDDDSLSWAEMAGYTVVDAASGRGVGRIAFVDDNTLNILLELEDGTLIPASEELITDINRDHRTITIAIPDGLLDINSPRVRLTTHRTSGAGHSEDR